MFFLSANKRLEDRGPAHARDQIPVRIGEVSEHSHGLAHRVYLCAQAPPTPYGRPATLFGILTSSVVHRVGG